MVVQLSNLYIYVGSKVKRSCIHASIGILGDYQYASTMGTCRYKLNGVKQSKTFTTNPDQILIRATKIKSYMGRY
jgi:hypothetical protein